jgi:hypothetical protein
MQLVFLEQLRSVLIALLLLELITELNLYLQILIVVRLL